MRTARRKTVYLAAFAELIPDPRCPQWKVKDCPLCGKEHRHGGPRNGGQRELLFHRERHCLSKDLDPVALAVLEAAGVSTDGYVLTDADPSRTARTLGVKEAE
jgi:threonine dehydrogenase-like Zn-dependent dehydrogenase